MDVIIHCSGHGSGRSNSKQQKSGYTLIELLIVLALISILLASTLPNFTTIIAQERSTILTNTIAGALAYARTEAITKQSTVVTCQSTDSSSCNNSGSWHEGWIIFVDKNGNKQREEDETLLRVYSAINNGTRAIFKGSAGIVHYVKYKPTGSAHPNGSFLICNPAIGRGKALIMTHSGRLRLSQKQTDGSAVTCR